MGKENLGTQYSWGIRIGLGVVGRFGLALGALIGAMGLGGSLWENQRDLSLNRESAAKSLQVYWSESNLNTEMLDQIFGSAQCQKNQTQFLGCIYSLESIAHKLGLGLSDQGKLFLIPEGEILAETEKESVRRWKKIYDSSAINKINFSQVWEDLKLNFIKPKEMSYYVAYGLNSFYSITRDPHSYIIPADYYGDVVAQLKPKSMSLGVVVAKGKDHFFIRKVLDSSSADKAGLKKGDILIEINGQLVQNLNLQKIGDLLRAEEGQTTLVLLQRGTEIRTIRVLRVSSEVPSVTSSLNQKQKMGLITINKFAKGSCEKTKESLQDLQEQGLRGLLVDLRDNAGGQVEEATCIASLFLGPGHKLIQLKYLKNYRASEEIVSTEQKIYSGALAILMNSGSASASEILAGVLQDKHRAVIVGERSFGKGTFQEGEIWDQNPKVALFETKGYFLLPSGRSPQLRGIIPDVAIKFKDSENLREEDLYWNPLYLPESSLKLGQSRSPVYDDCLGRGMSSENDPQIEKAEMILSCPSVATSLQE